MTPARFFGLIGMLGLSSAIALQAQEDKGEAVRIDAPPEAAAPAPKAEQAPNRIYFTGAPADDPGIPANIVSGSSASPSTSHPMHKAMHKATPATVESTPAKAAAPSTYSASKSSTLSSSATTKSTYADRPVLTQPVLESDEAYAKVVEARRRYAAGVLVNEIKKQIRRLTSAQYGQAKSELIKIGAPAVPFLIDAMNGELDRYPETGYSQVVPSRPTRQRSISDLSFEVLDEMIRSHSSYKGVVPARDQEAWRKFWSEYGEKIDFGLRP